MSRMASQAEAVCRSGCAPAAEHSRDGKLECRILLREPLPARDDAPRGNGRSSTVQRELHPAQGMEGRDLDDDVPF